MGVVSSVPSGLSVESAGHIGAGTPNGGDADAVDSAGKKQNRRRVGGPGGGVRGNGGGPVI